jgi:hypothetical protein
MLHLLSTFTERNRRQSTTAAAISAVRAELIGANRATALGVEAHGPSPVLALCRGLLEAGHDPATPLHAYRGDIGLTPIGSRSRVRNRCRLWRSSTRRGSAEHHDRLLKTSSAQGKMTMVNVSKYRGPRFIKLEDAEKHPTEDRIASVVEGKFGPDLTFVSGATVTLNKTSVSNLAEAWGDETDNWIAKTARAYAGDIPYQGGFKRGVVVVPVSPPIKVNDDRKPFDDTGQIPF